MGTFKNLVIKRAKAHLLSKIMKEAVNMKAKSKMDSGMALASSIMRTEAPMKEPGNKVKYMVSESSTISLENSHMRDTGLKENSMGKEK